MPISPSLLICSTSLALVAFAANSVLCRLALANNAIDAGSFTFIRLLSGAIMLAILVYTNPQKTSKAPTQVNTSWLPAIALLTYAAGFSYAYIGLDTGIGALILFAFVQITMISAKLLTGSRLSLGEWAGLSLAFSGLVYLLLPGISSPPLTSALIMAVAGVAWGIYSLKGRQSINPLNDTLYHFCRALPFALILLLLNVKHLLLTAEGTALAITSGAITSGLGYALWYFALRGLSITQAAVLQLLVPTLAAVGGVFFANELFTQRLLISSTVIIGGILLVVLNNQRALITIKHTD